MIFWVYKITKNTPNSLFLLSVWELYRKLKESALSQTGKEAVRREYEALTMMKSTSRAIQAVMDNFREYRDEMLKVLDHPNLPPSTTMTVKGTSEALSKGVESQEAQK